MYKPKVTYRDCLPQEAGALQVKFGDVLSQGVIMTIFRWHEKMLPEHFKDGADKKYSYSPRSKKYNAYKQKVMGHQTPLIWSGNLAEMLTQSSAIKVSATKTGKSGKGVLTGPKYLYAYVKSSKGLNINKAAEILTTTSEESEELAVFLDSETTKAINDVKGVVERSLS